MLRRVPLYITQVRLQRKWFVQRSCLSGPDGPVPWPSQRQNPDGVAQAAMRRVNQCGRPCAGLPTTSRAADPGPALASARCTSTTPASWDRPPCGPCRPRSHPRRTRSRRRACCDTEGRVIADVTGVNGRQDLRPHRRVEALIALNLIRLEADDLSEALHPGSSLSSHQLSAISHQQSASS